MQKIKFCKMSIIISYQYILYMWKVHPPSSKYHIICVYYMRWTYWIEPLKLYIHLVSTFHSFILNFLPWSCYSPDNVHPDPRHTQPKQSQVLARSRSLGNGHQGLPQCYECTWVTSRKVHLHCHSTLQLHQNYSLILVLMKLGL